MRGTPETDAFRDSQFTDRVDEMEKLYDLAEKLERERDETRADLAAEIKHHWDTIIKIACKLELEHNELREQNAKLRDIAERILLNCETLHLNIIKLHRAELDQLKEEVK
jgi:hypothetical protein